MIRTSAALLILLLCCASMSSAQIFKIGPGIEYASPMSDFSDRVGGGIGGAAQVKLDLPFITVLGAIDYISFAEKEVITNVGGNFITTKSSAEMWGLNAGATLGLFPMVYAGAEVGTFFVTEHSEQSGISSEGKLTRGSFAPLVGVSFSMVDLSARYVFLEDTNFLLLRAAVLF